MSLLSSILLIPAAAPPALSVAWTLVHEMMFYTAFATRYISRAAFLIISLAWVALIIGAHLLSGATAGPSWLSYVLSPLNLEFMLGVCLALLAMRVPRASAGPQGLVTISVITAVLAFYIPCALEVQRLVVAAAFGFLIVASYQAELLGRLRLPSWSVFLGAASYAIYLVHVPAISVVARVARIGHLNWLEGIVLIFCAGSAAGVAYHLRIEAPLVRAARRYLVGARHQPSRDSDIRRADGRPAMEQGQSP